MLAATIELDTWSRGILATVCMGSAMAAFALAIVTHPRYTPHMLLVGFWSVWFGAAMWDLTVGWFDFPLVPDDWLVESLNLSAAVAVGGWAVLGLRLWHEARIVRRRDAALAEKVIAADEVEAPE